MRTSLGKVNSTTVTVQFMGESEDQVGSMLIEFRVGEGLLI